ncbi:uncharacterized protein LOC143907508 isoform X2 [Temnothorax americanus]|uniref:uncharacterized protein LOC143907508 isoform X2 n=1 Tax=Temnothorax americanus TaxID=1964332 RepID=UPI0040680784
MLTNDSNNEQTTDDALNTCYGINTISYTDKNNENSESVMLTKDSNNEETTVDALNTCYDKESVILTKGCNNEKTTIDALNTCYDKKFVMLTNDSNNEQTTDDALNTCYGINTISYTDKNNENSESVMLTKDSNNEETTVDALNTCYDKESVILTKGCNNEKTTIDALNTCYDKKFVMLTNDSNNEQTTDDALNTCYGINTISYTDKNNENSESVMLTKDSNNEETTVDALNTCYDKESVILTKGCNNEETTIDALNTCYDKKFVMLTNDSNNEQTTDDALNTCYGINTKSYIDKNNENNSESVMLNKDSNNEETTVDALNTCYDKESVMLTNDSNNEETTDDVLNTCYGYDKYGKTMNIMNKDCDIEGKSDATDTCNIVENDDIAGKDVNVSLSDLLSGSIFFSDVEDCVRRLSFNEESTISTDVSFSNESTQVFNKEEFDDPVPSEIPIPSVHDVDNAKDSSDSEYLPSEDEQSISDNELPHEENGSKDEQNVLNNKLRIKHKSALNITASSASSLDASQINNNVPVCNDEVMYVESSNLKSVKRNYCIFCSKLQTQLVRHFEMVHKNEPDVKKFAILPKKNQERRKIIDILRKNGNFKFNTNSEVNNGQLIVCRRPNDKYNKMATDYTACAKCKAHFAKSTIRHHSRRCFEKKFTKNRCVMIMGRRVTCRLHPSASDVLRTVVFPVMREDDVTRAIRFDELLILYANKLCLKYKSQHQHDMIRAKLRILGRFLLALREINKNVENFTSVYHPRVYDDCITAINKVARYNNEEKIYEAPAVAANLSTLIKYIGNLLITECIKKEDMEKKKQVKDFLKLLTVDITTSVNRTVIETQSIQRRHKKVNLPSVEDIKKLYSYLEEKRVEAFNALQKSFSYYTWLSLAEVTLISIQVFNRRRAGEIERILSEDFKNYERVNKNMYSDLYKSLSKEHKKIANKYIRFCIRGKLGRTVPVLLSNDLFESINLILKYRKESNVPEKNPYVFGLPGYNKNRYRYLRACILMRKFSSECNAMQSNTLRGTVLRKHVATYCIQLNLNDMEVSDLATFMGHSEKIHKDHYRQPLATRDILQISQYLEAVQGNDQHAGSESSTESNIDDELYDDQAKDSDKDEEKENACLGINRQYTLDETQDILHHTVEHTDSNKKRKRSTSPYGKTKRIRWSEEEQEAALEGFAKYMEEKTLPSLKDIQEIRKKYKCLSKRTSPQIKTWIYNKQNPKPKKRKAAEQKAAKQKAAKRILCSITQF